MIELFTEVIKLQRWNIEIDQGRAFMSCILLICNKQLKNSMQVKLGVGFEVKSQYSLNEIRIYHLSDP